MATKPTPQLWVAGAKIAALPLNAGDYDVWRWLDVIKPVCSVTSSDTTSIASGTFTAMPFAGETLDTDNMHSTVTNNSRVTFNTAGWYRINSVHHWATNTTGSRGGYIRLNGTTIIDGTYVQQAAGSFFTSVQTPTFIGQFAVNDYIELMAYQNSGVAVAWFTSSGVKHTLQAEYLGTFQ